MDFRFLVENTDHVMEVRIRDRLSFVCPFFVSSDEPRLAYATIYRVSCSLATAAGDQCSGISWEALGRGSMESVCPGRRGRHFPMGCPAGHFPRGAFLRRQWAGNSSSPAWRKLQPRPLLSEPGIGKEVAGPDRGDPYQALLEAWPS